MRVLHLIDSLGRGGAEKHLLNLLTASPGEVVNVVAYFADDEALLPRFQECCEVVRVGGPRRVDWRATVRDVARLAVERRCLVIHTQLLLSTILGRFAGRRAGIPVVTTLQNTFYAGSDFGWPVRPRRYAVKAIDRATQRMTAGFVAVSESVSRHFQAAVGVPSERIRVIPNSVSEELASPQAPADLRAFGVPAGARVIVQVARLVPDKRHRDTIAALQVLNRAKVFLLLVGEGPLLESLQAYSRTAGVSDRVLFVGERDDVPAILKAADLFVLPSAREGFSVALAEALVMGVPIVATRIPQNVEVLGADEGGACAEVVPVGDSAALANAFCRILDDPTVRVRAEAAGRRAMRRLGAGAIGRALFAYIRDVAEEATTRERGGPLS